MIFSTRVLCGLALFIFLGLTACEESATDFEEPILSSMAETASPDTLMAFTVAQVKEIRQQSGIDQRAMAIEGVVSVGTSGNGNDDAWIQVLVKNDSAAERVRTALGDSLSGVPIKIAYSDTIRAH